MPSVATELTDADRVARMCHELEATRWVGRDVVIDGVEGVCDDQLYRAMDFLLACAERVQESVFFSRCTRQRATRSPQRPSAFHIRR